MNKQLHPLQQPAGVPAPFGIAVEQNDFARLNAHDILNIFLRHGRLIMAVVLIVTGIVVVRELTEVPEYTARAVTKIDMLPSLGAVQVSPQEREMRLETQTRLMASHSLAQVVAEDLQLHRNPVFMGDDVIRGPLTPTREQAEVVRAADKLHESMEVRRQSQNQLIEVAVTTREPRLSAAIADHFAVALQKWDNRARAIARRHSLAILGPQLLRAKAQLKASEQAVADARKKFQMLPGAGTEMDLAQINGVTNEFVSANALSAGSAVKASGIAGSSIGGVPLDAQTTPQIASQQRQYDDLQRRKAELSVTYGDNYPELKAINSEVGQLGAQIAEETQRARNAAMAAAAANAQRDADIARSDANGASARAGAVRAMMRRFTERAYANTQNGIEIGSLERDAAAKRDSVTALANRFELTMNNNGAGGIIATVLSGASIPNWPGNLSWRKAVTAALIGSFVLGCLLAFAREMTDNRLRSSHQVKRRFGLPTFGMLPVVGRGVLAVPTDNPVMRQPRSIFAETARALYNDVIHLRDGRSQVVAITSALPGEGKSTVALSLAAAAMMMRRRVILVDLDLRRHGILQDIQRQNGGPDLVDYLLKRRGVDDLVTSLAADRLRPFNEPWKAVLPPILSVHEPVGDPGALIASAELSELIDALRESFDFIVLNAPPLLAVRDAKILARVADDTLMVVKWAKTTIDEAEAAISTLDSAPAAFVFNEVDYAEHARRRYSDPIQFVARASDYYEDAASFVRPSPAARIRRMLAAFGFGSGRPAPVAQTLAS